MEADPAAAAVAARALHSQAREAGPGTLHTDVDDDGNYFAFAPP